MSVSESIGKLLLEGYKMLADSCDVCCTVLMQDRRGRIICVKCESDSMANAALGDSMSVTSSKMTNGGVNSVDKDTRLPSLNNNIAIPEVSSNVDGSALSTCEEVLTAEMRSAALTLRQISQQGHDLQGKLLYIKYIRECAETLQSLSHLRH